MKLSDQALGAIMMALQKSLAELTDIVPVLKSLDFEAQEDWLTGTDSSALIVDASTEISVYSYAAPTFASSTFDFSSGILQVTGNNFVKVEGAANDIIVNKFVYITPYDIRVTMSPIFIIRYVI